MPLLRDQDEDLTLPCFFVCISGRKAGRFANKSPLKDGAKGVLT